MAAGLTSLLVIRAIMGVAEGAVAPTGVAVVVEASHPHRRGINNGFFQCAIALFGLGVAPIMATQLLQHTSWRNVFLIAGIPGLVVAVFLWKIVREPHQLAGAAPAGAGAASPPLSSLFKHRNIPLSMLALLCAMVGIFVLSALILNHLADYLKLELTDRGFVSSAIGRWRDRAVRTSGVSISSAGAAITALSFVISAVFLWFFIHHAGRRQHAALRPVVVVLALFNFGSLVILGGPIRAEAAPGAHRHGSRRGDRRGRNLGGGIAPSIAGAVAQSRGVHTRCG
jgi:MFS family permease